MTDPIVVAADTAMEVPIPGTGRRYALRAPTYGEWGAFVARMGAAVQPNDAVFSEALRDAVREQPESADTAAMLAAIDACEACDADLSALFSVYGADRSAWSEEARVAFRGARRDLAAALGGKARAEWAMRDNPVVAGLREHRFLASQRQQVGLLALCLGWPEEQVLALPAGDVEVLIQAAERLVRPSAGAEKN